MKYTVIVLALISFLSCDKKKTKPADQMAASVAGDSMQFSAQLISQRSFWDSLPGQKGRVNDFEGLYSPEQESALDSIAGAYEAKTGIPMVIVTLDTSATPRNKFDSLSLNIAQTWKIGAKGKDNGMLICISKGYRIMRLDFGPSIDKLFTPTEKRAIVDNQFIAGFKTGDFYLGTRNGVEKLIEALDGKMK